MYSPYVLHMMKRTLLGVWARQKNFFPRSFGSLGYKIRTSLRSYIYMERVGSIRKPTWKWLFEIITLVFWKNSGKSQRCLTRCPLPTMSRMGRKDALLPPLPELLNPTQSLANMSSSNPGAPTSDSCRGQKMRLGTKHAKVLHVGWWFISLSSKMPSLKLCHRL